MKEKYKTYITGTRITVWMCRNDMAADPNCKTTKRKGHRDENEELEDRLFCSVRGHDERERPCSTERNGYELDAGDVGGCGGRNGAAAPTGKRRLQRGEL